MGAVQLDLADTIGQNLALFARQKPAELLLSRQDLVANLLQDFQTPLDRTLRPGTT